MKLNKRKRLFFDIETSPNIGLFWRTGWRERISPENIEKERSVICIGYKWEGERKKHCLTWDKNQNDRDMLAAFIEIMDEADELVAHNGERYDLPFVRTRCFYHQLPVFPDHKMIDTLKMAKRYFMFQSNKLDYIAKFAGMSGKIATNYDLWKKILLHNDEKALAYMVKYCKMDVQVLEDVFKRMNPYIPHLSNYAIMNGGSIVECPNCGSENMRVMKNRVSAQGTKRVQLQCNEEGCGKYHTVAHNKFHKITRDAHRNIR
jgi:DNA polymerase III epsilon subunit-like protein